MAAKNGGGKTDGTPRRHDLILNPDKAAARIRDAQKPRTPDTPGDGKE